MRSKLARIAPPPGLALPTLLAAVLLGAEVLWLYWPTLMGVAQRWLHDAKYSHGYLVPIFAAFLLWHRRKAEWLAALRPSWWGLPLLAAGLAIHFAGTYCYFPWFNAVALLPLLAGLAVLLGGWTALRWSWPALAFLLFMLPMPFRLETALAAPLQRVATLASVFSLQTLGFPAYSQGNVIILRQARIGVVEACNGMSMLVVFVALATAVVLLVRRPWPDKVLILLSAIPIALVCNLVRITATGVLHVTAGKELADVVFHDLAGWLMMPLALFLLWLEVRALDWVFVQRAAPQRHLAPAVAVASA